MPVGILLIRALHSHETMIAAGKDTPLDRLYLTIASHYHLTYLPGLLCKTRQTQPLHQLHSVPDWQAELESVYHINPEVNIAHNQNILIIDDLLTTGVTAVSIIQTI